MKKIKSNVFLYYLYSSFSELLILGPIIVIFMMAKGLSFTQIMLLQSVAAITVVLFEMPTGMFADKYKKKYSMFLGCIAWFFALMVYILSSNFWLFVLAEILFGIGTAFKDGANNAFIYQELKRFDRQSEYQKIEGKAQSLVYYMQAIGSIVAGFAYSINIHLPLIISCFFILTGACVSLLLNEEKVVDFGGIKRKTYISILQDSWKTFNENQYLKSIIFFSVGFFVFLRSAFWFFQPHMENTGIPVAWFGVVLFVLNIVSAITANKVNRYTAKTKNKSLIIMSMLLVASFFLLAIKNPFFGIMGMIIHQSMRGLYNPIITNHINNNSNKHNRATLLSLNSFLCTLMYSISIPIIGMVKDSTNVFITFTILAVVLAIVSIFTLNYLKHSKKMIVLEKMKVYNERGLKERKKAG